MEALLAQTGHISEALEIDCGAKMPIKIFLDRHEGASCHVLVLFTHGAGGDLHARAMQIATEALRCTSTVLRWNGKMNLASRVESLKLLLSIVLCQERSVCLAGRSMGARAAAKVYIAAHSSKISPRLLLFSYPLNGPEDSRADTLRDLPETCQVLFVTGTKDSMCPRGDLDHVRSTMKAESWAIWVDGANHGLSSAAASDAAKVAADWLKVENMPVVRDSLVQRNGTWDGWMA